MSIFKKFKPKYYAKIKLGPFKFRYFYTKEEYDAYMKKGKSKKEDTSKKKKSTKLSNLFSKTKTALSKIGNKTTKSITQVANKNKATVDKMISKNFNKTVKELKTGTKKVKNSVSKLGEETYSKLKAKMSESSNKKAKDFVKKKGDEPVNGLATTMIAAGAAALISIIGPAIINGVKNLFAKKEMEKATEDAPKSFKELNKKTKETSKDEDQKAVNPNYDKDKDGVADTWYYANNCTYCTTAYDLRQRGYDVEANPANPEDPIYTEDILSWYKGATVETMADVAKRQGYTDSRISREKVSELVEKELLEYGEGARGHFLYRWTQGGGHSVVWEVENGEVVIRDCQNNKKMKVADYMTYAKDFEYVRIDNLEPTEELLKTVRNKKK